MRRRPIWMVAAACVFALTASAAGAGQTGGPVASGEFTGVIAVTGGFSANVDEFSGGAAQGAITVTVDAQGPLELALVEGEMSGTWSLSGRQAVAGTITGSAGGATATISIEGGGPVNGSGTMGGPPSNYRLRGNVTSSNTVTVSVQGITSATNTASDTSALDEALTEVAVLCQDIYGRWDLRIRQQIDAIGFDEFIRGYFTASTGIDATEQAREVEALLADIGRWAARAGAVGDGELGAYLTSAFALLGRAQELRAELTADAPCPPDPRFATELTFAVQDALSTLIARFPGITRLGLVSLALGSGAIGGGSPSPATADALQTQMEADVNQAFEEAITDFPASEGDVIGLARTAQALGMQEIGSGGLSPADVLLVLTGGSS